MSSDFASVPSAEPPHYDRLIAELNHLLETARRTSTRAINAVMTATYWKIGRCIVEYEQKGARRAAYGEELLERLARDLTARFGRGFSLRNLRNFRTFYLEWPIRQTVSAESEKSDGAIQQTPSADLRVVVRSFPLPWSHYVRLMAVKDEHARQFYETEALRGGWSERQLDRQISTLFYERTALSRNKEEMLIKEAKTRPAERVNVDDEVKDPLVLEFLGLKDEYSESDLEEALLLHLEGFLLELGENFAFIGRQRRLRIGDEWYRVDLLFFHRRLRCLIVIDLKIGKLTHADAGQMHMYLNYAREHWMQESENPPVGLILCSEPNDALAQYALEGLSNKVLAREYSLALPEPKLLTDELAKTRRQLEARKIEGRGN
ncbi:PDDEXK nuclease domain-containing protein [Termitidicoccus mucosus]|uniref:50S ribosomal protein L31 n=1 Tax=Termitidicoccus mucosus TaxID=1184151 RepID=A0A178ICH2_9BACT|nr:hypothetical protein AW736_23950 [Opitutaceae bacterium TSB47]